MIFVSVAIWLVGGRLIVRDSYFYNNVAQGLVRCTRHYPGNTKLLFPLPPPAAAVAITTLVRNTMTQWMFLPALACPPSLPSVVFIYESILMITCV